MILAAYHGTRHGLSGIYNRAVRIVGRGPYSHVELVFAERDAVERGEPVESWSASWMDGGVRSGQDVLKAWALGARGTLIGRPFLYGLGALGQAGVTKALEIIHKELDLSMAFCGHTQLRHVSADILVR